MIVLPPAGPAAITGAVQDLWIAAAVRDHFQPGELLQQWSLRHDPAERDERGAAREAILELQEIAEQVSAPDGATGFTLHEQDRLKILGEAGADKVREELARIPEEQRSDTQRVLLDMVEGVAVEPDLHNRQALAVLGAAAACAKALGAEPPLAPADIQHRIEQLDYLAALGGPDLHRFVGRGGTIAKLRSLWQAEAADGPVLIEGVGGMGKSLLVSRFISELLEGRAGAPPSAVIHLDFDRFVLQRASPATIMAEVVRQVAARWQLAGDSEALSSLAKDVSGLGGSLEAVSALATSADAHRDLTHYARELVRALGGAGNCRILMFMDSFEQAQGFSDTTAESPEVVRRLLAEAGAKVFDIYAGRNYSPEWVQGMGRRPVHVRLRQLTSDQARLYLERELARVGADTRPARLRSITDAVGRSPLALRLAVALIEKEGWQADQWGPRLRQSPERIQAVLYDRILLRIRDEQVRKMAYPGLLVRRLTPAVIEEVLAGPCGLPAGEDFARSLLARAEREGQLFVRDPKDPGALRHRQDVRSLMLADLDQKVPPATARAINFAAVRHYQRADDLRSRTEELYHRLRLDQAAAEIDARWSEVAGARLSAVSDEFPARARRYLRSRLRAGSSAQFRLHSSGQPDDPIAFEEVRNYIRHEFRRGANPAVGRQLLEQLREARLDGLAGDLYAEILLAEGRAMQLVDETRRLLGAPSPRQPLEVRVAVLIAAATALEGLGNAGEAGQLWAEAAQSAQGLVATYDRDSEHLVLSLRARVGTSRIARKLSGRPSPDAQLAERVVAALPDLQGELPRQRSLLREIAAELMPFLAGPSPYAAALHRPIILLFDLKEAFPSALENPARCRQLSRRIFGRAMSSPHALHDTASKFLFGGRGGQTFLLIVKAVREEVDWTLKRAARG